MKMTLQDIYARCEEVGDCMEWQGGMSHGNTPVARVSGGNVVSVRRYIFTELLGNELPKGRSASIRCHNQRCVAEAHIYSATRTDIMNMAVETTRYGKRLSRNAKIAAKARARLSSLTPEQVQFIKESPLSGSAVAKVVGCAKSTANCIRSGRTWKPYIGNPWAGIGART